MCAPRMWQGRAAAERSDWRGRRGGRRRRVGARGAREGGWGHWGVMSHQLRGLWAGQDLMWQGLAGAVSVLWEEKRQGEAGEEVCRRGGVGTDGWRLRLCG